MRNRLRDGDRAWVTLTLENGIIELGVSDDGTVHTDSVFTADSTEYKGIAAIAERIDNMEGSVIFSDNIPQDIHSIEQMICEKDIDIALMDINLGSLSDADGLEIASDLLKSCADLKIIIFFRAALVFHLKTAK